MKVAILDDDPERIKRWSQSLGVSAPEAESILFTGSDLTTVVEQLSSRQLDDDASCALDGVDVVVVDYDLRRGDVGLTTGADIARLARCYTKCGPIVLLNSNRGASRERRFNLGLTADLGYFSDIEVGSDFLGNPGLWSPDAARWPAFRPWEWPSIAGLCGRLETLAKALEDKLDERVVDAVPDLAQFVDRLPREEIVWLGSASDEVSLRDLGAGPEAGRGLEVPLGPAGRDAVPEHHASRFAAARLMKWLDQFVRTRQVALVDAPHLVARYPGLLREGVGRDRLRTLDLPESALHPRLEEVESGLGAWVSRPVWWSEVIRADGELSNLTDPLRAAASSQVFCEDISRFLPESAARDYPLEINSPYRRRWVVAEWSDDWGVRPDYQPSQWFAL